jgi:hypothetical protein
VAAAVELLGTFSSPLENHLLVVTVVKAMCHFAARTMHQYLKCLFSGDRGHGVEADPVSRGNVASLMAIQNTVRYCDCLFLFLSWHLQIDIVWVSAHTRSMLGSQNRRSPSSSASATSLSLNLSRSLTLMLDTMMTQTKKMMQRRHHRYPE